MATKCIKIAFDFAKDNTIDKKDFYKELRDINYKTWLACNRAITYFYANDMQNMVQKDIGIPKQDDKELFGKSFGAWVENRMNELMEGCLSTNVAQTRQFVANRYAQDKKSGLFKGQVSLTQFKKDIPIIVHNKAYNIIDTDKGLGIEVSLFNKEKQKELNVKKIKLVFPKLDGSSKATLIKIMDKTYKQGSIQITYNERKRKWMMIISYTFEAIKDETLNEDITLGIDLGIVNVATMSLYDSKNNSFNSIAWKERIIPGDELIHYRQKIEARRKSLYIATKWSSDNASGHGYKRKTKTANKISDKYSRFRDTYNHKISRYIVDLAVKHKAKNIQMEDLSGFSDYQSESLLANWSYYDLQQKIKYKAEEKGINVIFINPQYTSKRCSKCGNIHEGNRDCKNNQAKFECIVCGHKENADINASKNIAIPQIDTVIKEYIKDKKEAAIS